MKKLLLFIMAFLLFLSLGGCSSNTENTSGSASAVPTASTESNEETKDNNDSLIEFDNVVIVDDDTVKVELVNFYAKDVNWSTGKRNDKYMTVKVTNKTDHKILFNLHDVYLGTDEVKCIMQDGNSGPQGGKSANFGYSFYHDTQPNPTEIESLDDLYDIEGTFEIHHFDSSGNSLTGSYETSFKLRDVIEGTASQNSGDAATSLSNEEIASIVASYSKWTLDSSENQGVMIFKDDNTGSFMSQLGDLPMEWSIDDSQNVYTQFEYSGTKYSASYYLEVAEDGSHILHNAKTPDIVWLPTK